MARLSRVDLFTNKDNVTETDYNINGSIPHPNYRSGANSSNDIGLIRLENSVNYTANLHPACLHQFNDDPPEMIVTGWGKSRLNGNYIFFS